MDYNTFDITKVNTYSENDQKSSSKHSASQSGFSFVDTLSGYLPNIKQPNAREAIDMQRADMRAIINTFINEYRIQTETKRIELLEKLLSKANDDDEDSYSKCMKIFSKLMRGEKVSPEEMKYLMQFAPLLFLMYQMLKDDEVSIYEDNSENESGDESSGSNIEENSSSLAEAVLTYTPASSAAAS